MYYIERKFIKFPPREYDDRKEETEERLSKSLLSQTLFKPFPVKVEIVVINFFKNHFESLSQTRHTIESVFTPYGLPGVPLQVEEKVFDFVLIKLGSVMK